MSNEEERLVVKTDQRAYTMVYNDFLKSKVLTAHEKIIYICLKYYGSREAWPSHNTLSQMTGLSKRTVQTTIDSMVEKGILKKKKRHLKNGGQTSNYYLLLDHPKLWAVQSIQELCDATDNLEIEMAAELLISKKIISPDAININAKKEVTSAAGQSNDETSNKNSFIYPNSNTEKSSCQERYTLENIKELFEYDILIQMEPTSESIIDSIMNILYDTLNSTKPMIRIGQEEKPIMVVIGRLNKLDYTDIRFVIENYQKQTHIIKNPNAYILTMLYKAKEQHQLDIENRVQYDMHNYNNDD